MATASSALPRSRFPEWIRGHLLGVCAVAVGMVNAAGAATEPRPFTPAVAIAHTVDAVTWAQRAEFRGAFPSAGRVIAEVSGLPADCAVQVGTQGFAASEDSPVDWTDGAPGQMVRHAFTVESGRSGKVWVMIRNRAASVSVGDWKAVSCSATGPWYTLPDGGTPSANGPAQYEGRAVRPPITFTFRAGTEAQLAPQPTPAVTRPGTGSAASANTDSFWFDAALGFGCELPAGWSVDEPGATTRRLRAPVGSPLATIKLEIAVAAATDTAASLMNKVHGDRVEAGAELAALGPLTIGRQDGIFAAHTTPSGDNATDIIVLNGSRSYRIIFEGPPAPFEEAAPLYRGVVASFSFKNR